MADPYAGLFSSPPASSSVAAAPSIGGAVSPEQFAKMLATIGPSGSYSGPSSTLFGGSFATTTPVKNIAVSSMFTPGGGSPMAAGLDVFTQSFAALINAQQERRAQQGQAIDLARLISEMVAANPIQAADFATAFGLPGLEPDLSPLNRFTGAGSSVSGKIGSQTATLPFSFTGKDLTFLGNNKNVASLIQQVASRLGVPDIFKTSAYGLPPTSQALLSGT